MTAHLVDDRGRVVLLFLSGKPLALVEYEILLARALLALLGLGNGSDELGAAPFFNDLQQFPVT